MVAWGQVCSSRRANRSPRLNKHTHKFSLGELAATPPIRRARTVFGRKRSWGYTSLAVARWFTPGYFLSPLRGFFPALVRADLIVSTCVDTNAQRESEV